MFVYSWMIYLIGSSMEEFAFLAFVFCISMNVKGKKKS